MTIASQHIPSTPRMRENKGLWLYFKSNAHHTEYIYIYTYIYECVWTFFTSNSNDYKMMHTCVAPLSSIHLLLMAGGLITFVKER